MKTPEHVKQYISTITPDQIGRAHKVYDYQVKQFVYLVESKSTVDELTGQPVEYRVTYTRTHGFQCTCPAGQEGFLSVRNKSGVCEHVRIALAAAEEERAYMAALALKEEPACDVAFCRNAATHFNGDVIEFRCESHK